MVANLEGVIFDQVYGDNSGTTSGQVPFDTDGDGTATQEDEFVSFTNTTTDPIDISGWQIWSDSTGGWVTRHTPRWAVSYLSRRHDPATG